MILSPGLAAIITLLLSYLAGAVPFGWIIVKITTGRDIRSIESGRTGGTNAMRAAGFLAGAFTAVGDSLKGFATFWLVNWLVPPDSPWKVWIQVVAPILAIMGHNYSIFMIETRSDGRLHLRGGAGGAPCFGGAMALWPWSGAFILPIAVLVFLLVGYASVTTLSIAVTATAVFAYLAVVYHSPWQYILYGVASLGILMWALRPNLVRLAQGNERAVGLRARLQKHRETHKSN
jgi:acyl phosphate:glycerol-3-phosphate acyltransferase